MLNVEGQNPQELLGHCYVHNKNCKVLPVLPHAGNRSNIAGVTCVDWSSMGKGLGWLGDSVLVFLQWLRERLSAAEDIIICECVDLFDDTMLRTLSSHIWSWVTLIICPSHLGIPVQRRRKWMIGLKRSTRRWHAGVLQAGVEETFAHIFHKPISLPGHALLRAPVDRVETYLKRLAAARGLPPLKSNGRPWSSWLLLAPGTKSRLQEYEDKAMATKKFESRRDVPFVVDTKDHASFRNCNFETLLCAPALLRRSKLYSFKHRRLVLPEELFELQGHNIYGKPSAFLCPFAHHLRSVSDGDLAAMAGNGMHRRVLQSVIAFVMAATTTVNTIVI